MGFDTLSCEYELPDKEVQDREFQTKSFDCEFDNYIISKDGKLLINNKDSKADIKFHGDVRFHTSAGKDNSKWYEYLARFTEGELKWIKRM
ncbi:MAG: hypothetical protein Q7R87_05020 [Nanoarchaeota archaeon]|nr:hypothetical protein [Nanoarchaeota archaeon]